MPATFLTGIIVALGALMAYWCVHEWGPSATGRDIAPWLPLMTAAGAGFVGGECMAAILLGPDARHMSEYIGLGLAVAFFTAVGVFIADAGGRFRAANTARLLAAILLIVLSCSGPLLPLAVAYLLLKCLSPFFRRDASDASADPPDTDDDPD